MGIFTSFLKTIAGIASILVLLVAVIIGWLSTQEHPEGVFFAAIIPIMKGYPPPVIFGHGYMNTTARATPLVPDDMKPQPRPSHELFITLKSPISTKTITTDTEAPAVPAPMKMPQNGLGMCCRPTAYDDIMVRRTVLWYLLLGGRLIDGADLYLNHKAIGLGVQDAIERGIPRSDIFITTKIYPRQFGYNRTLSRVPTYLEDLQVDYIDLILLHAPVHVGMDKTQCRKEGFSDRECRYDTFRALADLQQRGLVKSIGISNHGKEQVQWLLDDLDAGKVDTAIAVNQIQYNPWVPDHQVELFQYCQDRGIAITAYGSLGGLFQHSTSHTIDVLGDLSKKYNKSVPQLLLRWAMQQGAAVIPGTGDPKHMQENLDASAFVLEDKDQDSITKLRDDPVAKEFFFIPPMKDTV